MSTGLFTAENFKANSSISLKLSSGESVIGNISKLEENFLEIITSSVEAARKIEVCYAHIVYIEQIKVTTAAASAATMPVVVATTVIV